jgi:hypothetical protein
MCKLRIRWAAVALASTIFAFNPALASASIKTITFKELVASSEMVVLAVVIKVEEAPRDLEFKPRDERVPPLRVATAEVIETWKGPAEREIRFFASPLWQCDVSDAETGQRMVLCLRSGAKSGVMTISHGGRGGMPLRDIGKKRYATIDNFTVELPAGTPTIPGPDPRFSFIRSVELSKIKELVHEFSH